MSEPSAPPTPLSLERRVRVLVAPQDQRTIGEWLERGGERSPHTIRTYRRIALEAYGIIGKPLDRWTLGDLQQYLSLVGVSRARSTFEISRDALRSLFRYAYITRRITENPAALLIGRKLRRSIAKRLVTREEVYRMLAAARSQRDRTLVRFLYVSGLRVSEVAALRWDALRPCEATGGACITIRKKGGDEYEVGIPPATYAELLALPRRSADGVVFRSRGRRAGGAALSDRGIRYLVARVARLAGIERAIAPHFLRHAHASHAEKAGAGVARISRQLGHSSFAVTGLYVHTDPSDTSAYFVEL